MFVADDDRARSRRRRAARNNCLLPAALVYDPVTNPTGTRCGDPDLAAAVWGTTDRHPRRRQQRGRCTTNDNVGVQYGLKALLSGAITAEEFVTLNEKIGGVDADSNVDRGPLGRRRGGADDRLPGRHRLERQEPRQGRDHRFARLRRRPDSDRHPLQLAQLRGARAPRRRGRQSRQPGDLALRHRRCCRRRRRRSRR